MLVNPENVFEIRRALHRVLLDQPLRYKMKSRSYEQSQQFSWQKSAARVLQVYEEVCADGRTGQRQRSAQLQHVASD